MTRKSRIVTGLVLLGLLSAALSPAAFAGSPLLSGYGGPGAGEQAVIGSTLIGGSGGGAGSGGSGSPSSGGGGPSSSASGASLSATGGSPVGTGVGAGKGPSGAASGRAGGSSTAGSGSARSGANTPTQTHAFVYPPGLRSASADSPALGISGSDLLLGLAAIATLALVAAATLRLSRLQR